MGLAYVANINKIYDFKTEEANDITSIGLLSLGVHILTQSENVIKVMKNETLKSNILNLFSDLLEQVT